MKLTHYLAISIAFRDEAEIKEVLELSEKVKNRANFKQKEIYLTGLRALAGVIKKAKDLVK